MKDIKNIFKGGIDMDMDIKNLLKDEIVQEMEGLKQIEIGTKEYTAAVDGLTKLADRVIEMDKVENEKRNKEKENRNKEKEIEIKEKEIEIEEKEIRIKEKVAENETQNHSVQNCIAVAGIVVPAVLTVWGTIKSIRFEQTGTITTLMGRGFINKLLPKK